MTRSPARFTLTLPTHSLISPSLATLWLQQVSEAFGGQPAWSACNMRRLEKSATEIIEPLLTALTPEISFQPGCADLIAPQSRAAPLKLRFDLKTHMWESAEQVGWGIGHLAARIWRSHSSNPNLSALDGDTCLAACLGLAFLELQERQQGK